MIIAFARSLRTIGLGCLGLGLMLLVFSFILPRFDGGRSTWTQDDAKALQEAASRFHELTFSTSAASTAEEKQRLADAREAHDQLNAQRQEAIAGAKWRESAVRWSGVALVLVGLVVFAQQSRSP